MPKTLHFKTLRGLLFNPEYFIPDFAKLDPPQELHLGFQVLDKYVKRCGVLTQSKRQEDGNKFMALAAELNAKVDRKVEELDEKLLREFASQARGYLCPMQAVIGGMAAHEVMKIHGIYAVDLF